MIQLDRNTITYDKKRDICNFFCAKQSIVLGVMFEKQLMYAMTGKYNSPIPHGCFL